jgi:RND family efflux transporter MFP subunit
MRTVRRLFPIACVLSCAFLWGCSDNSKVPVGSSSPAGGTTTGNASAAGNAASASAAPTAAVTVTTIKAQKRDLPVTLKATGTVTPLTSVEVKAQVTSTVTAVHFKEGQFVKAGQLLFTLDARTDEANAAKARAQLAKDNASLADAKRQFERAKQLFTQSFISQGAVDTAQAQVDAIVATIAADQAAIDATRVALSFARITAPNAGRAGAVIVSAGSAIQANLTTLVTITQLDPIGVAFSIPQRNLSDALSALKDGGAPVTATLADGGGRFQGRLQFVDSAVDASSGTVKAKAVFANQENKLWPGAFVEISQTVATLSDAVILPQVAIIQGARGTTVYVVEGGKAVQRPVKLVYAEGGDAAVTGVKPGESVIMDGKQNVRPNAPVVERSKETKGATPDAGKP